MSERSNDTCQNGFTLKMRGIEGFTLFKGDHPQYSIFLQI